MRSRMFRQAACDYTASDVAYVAIATLMIGTGFGFIGGYVASVVGC